MTEDQATEVISQLGTLTTQLNDVGCIAGNVAFCAHLGAFACCMLWGSLLWRAIVIAKNQRGWW